MVGEGKRKWEKGEKRGENERERGGDGKGPQFEKNDPPPSSDARLRACITALYRLLWVYIYVL